MYKTFLTATLLILTGQLLVSCSSMESYQVHNDMPKDGIYRSSIGSNQHASYKIRFPFDGFFKLEKVVSKESTYVVYKSTLSDDSYNLLIDNKQGISFSKLIKEFEPSTVAKFEKRTGLKMQKLNEQFMQLNNRPTYFVVYSSKNTSYPFSGTAKVYQVFYYVNYNKFLVTFWITLDNNHGRLEFTDEMLPLVINHQYNPIKDFVESFKLITQKNNRR